MVEFGETKYRERFSGQFQPNYATSAKFNQTAWNGVTLFDYDRVLYSVDGANKEPLARLYYCKYCLELRSENSDKVQTEIDSHYCVHALDNVPTTEGKEVKRGPFLAYNVKTVFVPALSQYKKKLMRI